MYSTPIRKSCTIRESNQASGIVRRITHCTMYKKLYFVSRNGHKVNKFYSMWVQPPGFSPIKINFSDYLESLVSRINKVFVFFNKISLYAIAIFY